MKERIWRNRSVAGPSLYVQALIPAAILGAAVFFRLSDLTARNLWTDEAWVALAALASTPGEALTFGRSTPPFYVLTLWGLVRLLGGSEGVLRSLSLVFGIGTIVFFRLTARRLAPPGTSLAALTLVAFSPVLVYFSKELKQYSGDAFFSVLLVWLAERLNEHPGRVPWLSLALAGLLALGFSHGAVFVLPAVLGVLWLRLPRPQRRRLFSLGAFWGTALVIFFVLFYRRQVDPELVAYWAADYPDFSGLVPFLSWLGGAWNRYFHYFFHYFFSTPWGYLWGVGFTILGVQILAWNGPRRLLLYWGGPLALALLASALHRYPFMGHYNGSRLFLFSAPWLYLIAAFGLAAVFGRLRHRLHRWPALALAAVILLTTQPLALIQENLHPHTNRQELKPLVVYLNTHLQVGDAIYVYYHAIYPFKYYFQGDTARVLWGGSCVETDLALPDSDSGLPRRVWVVAAHFKSPASIRHFAARLLGPTWQEAEMISGLNAALLLFVRKDQPSANLMEICPKSLQ